MAQLQIMLKVYLKWQAWVAKLEKELNNLMLLEIQQQPWVKDLQ